MIDTFGGAISESQGAGEFSKAMIEKIPKMMKKGFPSTTLNIVSCGRSGKITGCTMRSTAPVWAVQISNPKKP